ncbi:hypothetical protein [Modestobacter sp. SYSU DS0875]
MTTFVDLPTRTSPRPADVETDLAALLELFTVAEADEPESSPVESLRGFGVRLRELVRYWSRRAADWGAAPGTAAAWFDRPVRVPVDGAR